MGAPPQERDPEPDGPDPEPDWLEDLRDDLRRYGACQPQEPPRWRRWLDRLRGDRPDDR